MWKKKVEKKWKKIEQIGGMPGKATLGFAASSLVTKSEWISITHVRVPESAKIVFPPLTSVSFA